jgi:uncharacterized tellurite resistance protein B-like protein
MGIEKLANVFRIISGDNLSAEQYNELKKEAVLMTLARGTSQDSEINPLEVATVRQKVEEITGVTVSDAEVRVAAHSELYETVPFKTCLSRLSSKLKAEDRAAILRGLADVLRSDLRVQDVETAYFDEIAGILQVRPSQIAGLVN